MTQTMKILIADDFQPFRTGLQRFIQQFDGVEVVGQATDGLEAVILAKHYQPDLIFLDISMPHLNGFDAARQIHQECPASKIVFVTVHKEETYRAMAEILQADGYLSKSELSTDLPGLLKKLQQPSSTLT